jgi:hypothetical protein
MRIKGTLHRSLALLNSRLGASPGCSFCNIPGKLSSASFLCSILNDPHQHRQRLEFIFMKKYISPPGVNLPQALSIEAFTPNLT